MRDTLVLVAHLTPHLTYWFVYLMPIKLFSRPRIEWRGSFERTQARFMMLRGSIHSAMEDEPPTAEDPSAVVHPLHIGESDQTLSHMVALHRSKAAHLMICLAAACVVSGFWYISHGSIWTLLVAMCVPWMLLPPAVLHWYRAWHIETRHSRPDFGAFLRDTAARIMQWPQNKG